MDRLAGVTGDTPDVTALVQRFSPTTNAAPDLVGSPQELRVLIATDVLSEGQNLQGAAILVNFDLPWAIIRLVQRAGRVDRIGQQAPQTVVHTFMPAEGIEQVIRLRGRVNQRLREAADVLGSDEVFFDDATDRSRLVDLYHEKADALDDTDADAEVDLESEAYQIWHNAKAQHPHIAARVEALPDGVFATRAPPPHVAAARPGDGVLAFLRTPDSGGGVESGGGGDHLAWLDADGRVVTRSQIDILRAAACEPDTPALTRLDAHHALVAAAAELAQHDHAATGGLLGTRRSVHFQTYSRLTAFALAVRDTLQDSDALRLAIDDLARAPLTAHARDTLARQLRARIADADLVALVLDLRRNDRLCLTPDSDDAPAADADPLVVCSLGLRP